MQARTPPEYQVESTTGAVAQRPRFQSPLGEPDVRVSRIRLSLRYHVFAHGKLRVRCGKQTSPSVSYRYSFG